jgi:hypothetical protein
VARCVAIGVHYRPPNRHVAQTHPDGRYPGSQTRHRSSLTGAGDSRGINDALPRSLLIPEGTVTSKVNFSVIYGVNITVTEVGRLQKMVF